MANYFKVSPKWKKSIYEYSKYQNDDNTKSFVTEEMYRWGHCIIKVENDEELSDIIGDPTDSGNEFEFDHTTVEEQEVDDQCSFYFQNCKGILEEELDEKYEEDGYEYLEKNYGEPTDFWTIYHGELDVEDVTEEWSKK